MEEERETNRQSITCRFDLRLKTSLVRTVFWTSQWHWQFTFQTWRHSELQDVFDQIPDTNWRNQVDVGKCYFWLSMERGILAAIWRQGSFIKIEHGAMGIWNSVWGMTNEVPKLFQTLKGLRCYWIVECSKLTYFSLNQWSKRFVAPIVIHLLQNNFESNMGCL